MKKMTNKEAKYWNDMIDKIARDLGIDKIKKVDSLRKSFNVIKRQAKMYGVKI